MTPAEAPADLMPHPDGSGRLGVILPWSLCKEWGAQFGGGKTPAVYVHEAVGRTKYRQVAGAARSRTVWSKQSAQRYYDWLRAQEFDAARPHEVHSLPAMQAFVLYRLLDGRDPRCVEMQGLAGAPSTDPDPDTLAAFRPNLQR